MPSYVPLVVLFVILALLMFGPRRGGRIAGPIAIVVGMVILIGLAAAFGLGWVWNAIVGPIAQP